LGPSLGANLGPVVAMQCDRRRQRLALALASILPAEAFYLPGVAPSEYKQGETVHLQVNKLTSVKTQLPYGFYTMPFCTPQDLGDSTESLGEILLGDQVENSAFEIKMNVNESCKVLCEPISLKDKGNNVTLKDMIDNEYQVNWLVDNLPAATPYTRAGSSEPTLHNGFPVGLKRGGRYYLHNHFKLTLKHHTNADEFVGFRIVGAEVMPRSVVHSWTEDQSGHKASCEGMNTPPFDLDSDHKITYSYDVVWVESEVTWATRWDNYLRMSDAQVHWFSIINSVMVVLFLSAMVAMILARALRRDITKYNEIAAGDEVLEESGWKLVHADVFRKPVHSQILAMSVGSGTQLLVMSFVTVVLAAVGFVSPAYRGGIVQTMLMVFTFLGIIAGYVSARFYKMFKGENWKRVTLITAFLYPGVLFIVFFIVNLFLWARKSTGAVPFLSIVALMLLWFGISVPLVFVGAYLGFSKPPVDLPVRTNKIPRQIPVQPWFLRPWFTCGVGAILPFGAVFTELFFIMSSVWQHQFYYLFGLLMLVLIILVVTCAEISITLTYFQLTSEDYNWWWRSFFASACSGVYVFIYSWIYFSTRLQITQFVSTVIYFGYMGLLSYTLFLITGSVGTLATFLFLRLIYGSIKID